MCHLIQHVHTRAHSGKERKNKTDSRVTSLVHTHIKFTNFVPRVLMHFHNFCWFVLDFFSINDAYWDIYIYICEWARKEKQKQALFFFFFLIYSIIPPQCASALFRFAWCSGVCCDGDSIGFYTGMILIWGQFRASASERFSSGMPESDVVPLTVPAPPPMSSVLSFLQLLLTKNCIFWGSNKGCGRAV